MLNNMKVTTNPQRGALQWIKWDTLMTECAKLYICTKKISELLLVYYYDIIFQQLFFHTICCQNM